MKKIISMVICLLMMFGCINISAEKTISVEVDASIVEFDTSPINIDGRVLVPVRAIYEAMGATVLWDSQAKTVTSILGKDIVKMTIENTTITVNDEVQTIDVAPQIINDRTLIPVRAAAEAFSATVSWEAENNHVKIVSDDFSRRISSMKQHDSSKSLDEGKSSNFSMSYFEEYDARINANDGTDFEIVAEDSGYYSVLSVRSDLYRGVEQTLTNEYAKSVSDDIVNLVSGTLISSDITTLGETPFIKTHYTMGGVAGNVNDFDADVIVYTGTKNGIVYTVTYSSYGETPKDVSRDMIYMLNTLSIK